MPPMRPVNPTHRACRNNTVHRAETSNYNDFQPIELSSSIRGTALSEIFSKSRLHAARNQDKRSFDMSFKHNKVHRQLCFASDLERLSLTGIPSHDVRIEIIGVL